MTDGNIGAKQTLQRFLVFANQGLKNMLYKRDRIKKRHRERERMRIISQMLKRYIVLFFPVLYVLVVLYLGGPNIGNKYSQSNQKYYPY